MSHLTETVEQVKGNSLESVERFTFSCATFLLSRGVDIKVVSEILGHSTIAVTANTYAHVTDALKADALAHFKI